MQQQFEEINENKMSVLCERPDSEFFLTIPDLHDAVHSFLDNEVKSKLTMFGHIFVKYGVTKDFGLAMVHRHFDISRDEILVETLNVKKTISVTSPWVIEEKTLSPPVSEILWKEHDTEMKKYVVPQTWSFDKNGNLKSFEYLASDSPMQAPPPMFVSELYSELKKLGLEGNLGIRRIINVIGQSSWETTPEGTRSNVVVFGTKPDDTADAHTVAVLWYFDENGSICLGASCLFCPSCRHCNHCNHCRCWS